MKLKTVVQFCQGCCQLMFAKFCRNLGPAQQLQFVGLLEACLANLQRTKNVCPCLKHLYVPGEHMHLSEGIGPRGVMDQRSAPVAHS